jgi:hypothetical protein
MDWMVNLLKSRGKCDILNMTKLFAARRLIQPDYTLVFNHNVTDRNSIPLTITPSSQHGSVSALFVDGSK